MTDISGLLVLIGGLGALAGTGAVVACCLRVRSPLAFLLAAYVIGWTWIVALSLALSPLELLTRAGLLAGLALGLAVAIVVWSRLGRPAPPAFGPAWTASRAALRNPAVLTLGVAVGLGTVYVGALAFLTPANDWDGLSYHLARADFWKQEHGLGYVAGTADPRLDVNPPNAEIGQLATMILSGSDRYIGLVQLLAYAALGVCVAGLARRLGLGVAEALFAALAFSTLPLLTLQASGSLNDLVLASFLAVAGFFALQTGRASLVLVALAVGLAIGTKFTGLLALPTLALVAAIGRPPRQWVGLALAGVAGLALGSTWYVLNVVETGELDGGAADEFDQRAELGTSTFITAMRLVLSFVDMSGADQPQALLFFAAAGVLALAGLARRTQAKGSGFDLLLAAVLTATVVGARLFFELGVRITYKAGLLLGAPLAYLDEVSWELNTRAEPTIAWYGPLAPVLLVAVAAIALVAWRRGRTSALTVALAAAPLVLVATLALTITWDPWRGRFVLFGVTLAAATWGVALRSNVLSAATAAIGATALVLALANYHGKPAGLFSGDSIWGAARWKAQTWISGPGEVLRFVEESVPEDTGVGLSLLGNHHIHPYFGPNLSRHLWLVSGQGGNPPAEAEWLVLAPGTVVKRCPGSWRPEFRHQGWSVERRVAPDACLSS